jgi:hypothetical protein
MFLSQGDLMKEIAKFLFQANILKKIMGTEWDSCHTNPAEAGLQVHR